VISEAYTVIRYRAEPGAARRVLDWADTVDRLPVDDIDHDRTHALLRRHTTLRISYVDALLMAVAERRRAAEVLTLDAELGAVRLRPAPVVTVL
jgi:predicted nucleic acid-binding protein